MKLFLGCSEFVATSVWEITLSDYEVWGRKELHAENSYMWWVVPLFVCTVSTPHTLQHSAAHTLHIPGWQFPCSTPRMDWKRIFGRDYICAKVGAFTYTPHSRWTRWTYCVRILQCSIYDAHMHALKHTYVCTYIRAHRKGTQISGTYIWSLYKCTPTTELQSREQVEVPIKTRPCMRPCQHTPRKGGNSHLFWMISKWPMCTSNLNWFNVNVRTCHFKPLCCTKSRCVHTS